MIPVGGRRGLDCVDVLLPSAENAPPPAHVARTEEPPKYFWLELDSVPSAEWDIDVLRAGRYRVEVAVRTARATVSVAVDGAVASTREMVGPEWDEVDLGLVWCPAGHHRLSIVVESVGGYGSQLVSEIRSVALVHEDELDALAQRLARFTDAGEVARQRLRESNFGLMFQYGPWSYPPHGPDKPGLQDHVDAFDVVQFADEMAALGVGHVVWSLSWWTYTLATPSRAVDWISGTTDLTSRRDLVLELATALKARGIMFLLYYHLGHDQHVSGDSGPWWRAQHWPAEFSHTGQGDRGPALANLQRVLTELGARYGDLLDGWLVDDGIALYPAPFERLGQSLRAGNPGRLVAYNSWIVPKVTPFQDLDFGEGLRDIAGLDIDDDGLLRSGPSTGLLAHAMTPLQPAWGVYAPEQMVELDDWVEQGLDDLYDACRKARVPLTLDLLMWSPGVIDPQAVERVARLSDGPVVVMTKRVSDQ
jgi:hypothetical protein